jgi:hypothetical protein
VAAAPGVPLSEPTITGGQIAGELPGVLPVRSPPRPGRLGRERRCPATAAALAHVRRSDGEAQRVDPGHA